MNHRVTPPQRRWFQDHAMYKKDGHWFWYCPSCGKVSNGWLDADIADAAWLLHAIDGCR